MLSWKEYREAVRLHRQGWSIIRISRHLGRDRKTVRSYLRGERTPGIRISPQDGFLQFLPYCRQRLAEDPHLAATVLFDEIVDLGYAGGYSTFTGALRRHRARPSCRQCQDLAAAASGRPVPEPGGGTIEFDWLRLPEPRSAWGYGNRAGLLVGSLTEPGADAGRGIGRWSVALAEDQELPHLVEAVDLVLRRLGGTAGSWRFGRMPTVWCPRADRVTPEFRQVAGHYGVRVECRLPADQRSYTRRTLDEALRSWWRGLPEDTTLRDAWDGLGRSAARLDTRRGSTDTTALRELPAPYPVRVRARRTVTAQGLVAFRGNFYALPEHLVDAPVEVRRRLDQSHLSIATPAGAVIARCPLAPPGAGLTVVEHSSAITVLERHPAPAPTDAPLCRRHTPRPPSPQALAEADALRARLDAPPARRPGGERNVATPRVPTQRDRPTGGAGS
ncbi:Mu transposase domain-containing protein [Kitasatospora cathayae]|uniref:IS21 family transposase n=1 Tax=Kitasatospora cathayae TaxID=3004092 RepID=A0ABY7Q592_9ACTN|nr:IS21 family transposase [Kitasatospora sp. HUAS 3-15]WBP87809.1 IS21 family transposase [Kitasatospora sp. HUAS 3-15]